MRVLVTGGSGFLGVHVREFFHADDFSRRSGLDILNLHDCRKVEEYDAVIHLAAHLDKSAEAAEESFLTNAEGTVNILRSVQPNAAFIFASTKDVYGKWAEGYEEVAESCPTDYCGQSPLEWSKLIAERYVEYYAQQRGFRAAIFRLSTVYAPASAGNSSNFVTHYAEAINKGERIALPGNGKPMRDLLRVEDLARACKAFIDGEGAGGIFNIGGGQENSLTLRGLVAKMEEISGLQAVIEEDESGPAPVPFNYVSDISKARAELNWQPEISPDEGLKTLF
jgi:nucleoside-diphosphate-sugar epimerase